MPLSPSRQPCGRVSNLNQFTRKMISFLYLGVIIVIFIAGIVIFSWLLLLGAIVGAVLFLLAWIRDRFSEEGKKNSKKIGSPG